MKLVRIEIDFPLPVELTGDDEKQIHDILCAVCDRYEAAHPDRVMWVFGVGCKMHFNPTDCLFLGKPVDPEGPESGEPTSDDDVLHFDIHEREKY